MTEKTTRQIAQDYVQKLDACGWFEGLPSLARQFVEAQVAHVLEEGRRPWYGLVAMWDPELVERYRGMSQAQILREFAAASWGDFSPYDVTE